MIVLYSIPIIASSNNVHPNLYIPIYISRYRSISYPY
jgi:hypothetical protein